MAITYNQGIITTRIISQCDNALDLRTLPDRIDKTYTQNYTAGTGANQSQIQWADSRSLLTTANETLDLRALTNDAFGTYTFAKLRELIIAVTTLTPGYRLLVGGAASNAFSAFAADPSDIVYVPAGGIFRISSPVDGFTVDATHKDLKIENPSGGTCAFDIIIIGTGTVA
jgi:hypothetical protein